MQELNLERLSICDNCQDHCSTYIEDSTIFYIGNGEDRKFRWGNDCNCANKRKLLNKDSGGTGKRAQRISN